jgi:hypothetical protein
MALLVDVTFTKPSAHTRVEVRVTFLPPLHPDGVRLCGDENRSESCTHAGHTESIASHHPKTHLSDCTAR